MTTIVAGDALLCASTIEKMVKFIIQRDNFSRRFKTGQIFSNHFHPLICGKKYENIMIEHNKILDRDLRNKIKNAEICFGGNQKLKIYGTLKCSSGKRMKRENRVFFLSENEARQNGFRPCGHCMKTEYQNWKNGLI